MKKSILLAVGKRVTFNFSFGYKGTVIGKIMSVDGKHVHVKYLNCLNRWSNRKLHNTFVRNVHILKAFNEYAHKESIRVHEAMHPTPRAKIKVKGTSK